MKVYPVRFYVVHICALISGLEKQRDAASLRYSKDGEYNTTLPLKSAYAEVRPDRGRGAPSTRDGLCQRREGEGRPSLSDFMSS